MYATILLPSFRLQAATRWRRSINAQPVAVIDTGLARHSILECNESAYNYGLTDGMNCTQALARCPDLELLPRTENEEKTGQAILLETGFSLTPDLEETELGCITLDISKIKIESYGIWANAIIERLKGLNFNPHIGIAPNPDLAYLAAKKAENYLHITKPAAFLKNLAISDIETNQNLISLLEDWGIHDLGQLIRLPKREFAARLGPQAENLWLKASGKTMRILKLAKQVDEYCESYDFEYQIETVEPLYFIINRFLKSLSLRLEGVNRVAKTVELTLVLDNAPVYRRLFSIAAPTRNPTVIMRIINTHLEGLKLTNAISGIKLLIEPVKPNYEQLSIFDSAIRDINSFLETLARIIAVVGNGNVGIAVVCETHKPDSFKLEEPKFDKLPEHQKVNPAIGLPLKRFRPPLTAQVAIANHMPIAIRCDKVNGKVVDMLGPYRASGDWWQNSWQSEEWDIEVAGGKLFRISRNENNWQVEGCYGS